MWFKSAIRTKYTYTTTVSIGIGMVA